MTVAAVGAAFATFAIAAPAPRASAAPASACTPASGVTAIVDFTHFGGAIERGCAAGNPTTALVALRAAGFAAAGTANYGDAFVCRIDGLPVRKTESCVATPPGDASWSFYFAKRSDKVWTYSALGVTSFQPGVGSLVAFAFGNHAKPGVPPSGAIATRPTTPPPAPTTHATAPTSGVTSPRVTAVVVAPTSTATTGPPRATTSRPSSRSTSTTAASTTSIPIIDRSTARMVSRESSGSPFPAVFTVTLVAVIGTVAILMIRARRRRSA